MKQYLVCLRFDEWCQGYEETWGYFLVTATSFEEACEKLRIKLHNAREFQNHTID